MASIVITALRGEGPEAGPSAGSLGLAALGRQMADRLGATVYASCSLSSADDLDIWVSALGRAGVDRIACARSPSETRVADAEVHAELARRLEPLLVLVPSGAAGAPVAERIAEALATTASFDACPEWSGEAYRVGDRALGDGVVIVATHAATAPLTDLGSDDIDVLFFNVEETDEPAPEADPAADLEASPLA